MNKRFLLGLAPLLAVVALPATPVAAQAAGPHWLNSGIKIKEGVKTPVLIYGGSTNLSEMNSVGETNCRDVGGGTIENPAGGGPGVGTIYAMGFYECKSAGCERAGEEEGIPLTIEIEWNDAPVSLSLTGEGASEHETLGEPFTTFSEYGKLVTKGEVQMRLACETPPGYEPHVVGVSFTEQGQVSPNIGPGQNGASSAKPSAVTFSGASTGALHGEVGGASTFSGPLKYLGYNFQQVITVE